MSLSSESNNMDPVVNMDPVEATGSAERHIPFVDLMNFTVDPTQGLAELVNKSYAYHHRVVPIARSEGTITVAMEDPTDLAVIKELECVTQCSVRIVTSTRAGFQRAFTRVYAWTGRPSVRGT